VKKYLTVPETAEITGKTIRATWQDLYRGRLPYRRWGRRILVPRDELEQFLKALPGVTVEEAVTKVAR
jgi:excisionase family DNA binding protein